MKANSLIATLRSFCKMVINRIDDGDCDLSEDEASELVETIKRCTEKDVPLSKYQACEYLGVKRATFDNYVANGLIPKGMHQQGFKELSWFKKDLDKFKAERTKSKK